MTAKAAPVAELRRADVLAFRAHAQGLDRWAAAARDLPLLALGVQDSPPGAARLAFAARTPAPTGATGDPAWWEDDAMLWSAWTVRGAPHVHRRAELPSLAEALWPHDDRDAASRLAWNATRVREGGVPPLQCLALATAAVAEVAALDPATLDATGLAPVQRRDGELGLSKGLLSREVSRRVPAGLRRRCEPCQVEHVFEQLLRLTALPGGLALESGAPVVLGPVEPGPPPGIPDAPGDLTPLVRAYLHLFAPATPSDVAAFLGSTAPVVQAHWPPDAVPVEVDTGTGRRTAWALADDVPALADPPAPPGVRLLPPNDAFGKAGDREVLVPDRAEQKVIWRVLGSPGLVLVDALPAGVWRPKASGRRLELRVETFAPLPAGTRRELEAEAERVAAVRGLALTRVTW